jgi:thymidylate kinase
MQTLGDWKKSPPRRGRHGILVAFSGVDGSGKSTQVDLLEESFKKVNVSVLRIRSRWRPVLSLPLLVIMRKLGYARVHRAGGVYIVETRLPSRGGLTSLWCILTQIENIVKTGVKLVFPLLLGRTVICDRYALDMVVDGMAGLHDRARHTRFGFRLLRFLPKPNHAFFMDIDPEVAFKRKPDLPSLEDYVERLQLYRELSSSWGVTIVNARVSADAIHRKVWKTIVPGPLDELAGISEEVVGPIARSNIHQHNINS